MTLLFSCQNIGKSFGTRTLFQGLGLGINEGDQIGLIGPNGSGKSTFLKILAGVEKPDQGILSPRKGLKVGYVPQECDFGDESPLAILMEVAEGEDYEKEQKAEMWLSKLGFEEGKSAAQLSGGWKKRLKIAVEMVQEPDLILFDEPTNHLDLEGILWLEKFLQREAPTYVLVSHDRYFLQNTTTRMIEMSHSYPNGIFAIDGNYAEFLKRKEEFLSGQLKQEQSINAKARKEEAWLKQGAKARTTKAQSRIDDAEELFELRGQIAKRNTQKRADVGFVGTERETRKLLSAKNVGKSMGGKPLFAHLDLLLTPGSRVGLMGPNGSGKTTFLKILAGEIEYDQGTIKKADDLKIVYFDQHRMKVPTHLSLRDALSPKGDYVHYHGQEIHVNGWCKRFLFSPDLLELPISKLSGGERARISIAHLMLQPADVLLLDEPTNDLDIVTLETLEESLLDFPGALVLITHDRCMLDRICNSMLTLGDKPKETPAKETITTTSSPKQKAKLSYTEKREYEEIEVKIAKAEGEIAALNKQLEIVSETPQKLSAICTEIALIEAKIEQLYLRWNELDQKTT